ncbi:hypothetical protein PG989_000370 [Apiospora arundinis]
MLLQEHECLLCRPSFPCPKVVGWEEPKPGRPTPFGKPPSRARLGHDPVSPMLHSETFPQECSSPGQKAATVPPRIWYEPCGHAFRVCTLSRPQRAVSPPSRKPTDMRIRPLRLLRYLRRSQCCLGAAATPRRPQAPVLVRVGTAPQTALWSYHSTTAHRQPWA